MDSMLLIQLLLPAKPIVSLFNSCCTRSLFNLLLAVVREGMGLESDSSSFCRREDIK
uniref:Uncharacterized protein n=1 Tax=Amphimedon queenslandica TaxID=400682 RepID=A0A1X7V8U0_AMPQE